MGLLPEDVQQAIEQNRKDIERYKVIIAQSKTRQPADKPVYKLTIAELEARNGKKKPRQNPDEQDYAGDALKKYNSDIQRPSGAAAIAEEILAKEKKAHKKRDRPDYGPNPGIGDKNKAFVRKLQRLNP